MPSGDASGGNSDNREFLGEFVVESHEHLDTAEQCLLKLHKAPDDREPVQACFRALHTIKGGAGFMALERIQSLAHVAEQVLDAIRENRLSPDAACCDTLLAAVSRLRELIDGLNENREPAEPDDALKNQLGALLPTGTEDDYAPSHAPARRAEATSRRLARQDAHDLTIDGITGELVALAAHDAAGFEQVLDRLGQLAQTQSWTPAANDHLARMRALVAQLADPASRDAAHAGILAHAETLMKTVVSARLRKATAHLQPAITVPDLPSIADFASESIDLLARAEAVLLAQGELPADATAELFRSFHTVKGMAAYLGHPRVEALAHAIESRLEGLRDGGALTADLRQLGLAGVDGLRALVGHLRQSGSDSGAWPPAAAMLAERLGLPVEAAGDTPVAAEVPRLGDLLVQTGQVSRAEVEAAAAHLKPGERLGDRLVESGKIKREVVEQAVAKQAELAAKAQADAFARVSIARLEELVNLVGELLITQAMVSGEIDALECPRLATAVQRQARVVRDLQGLSLGLRLVPLRATFQKMARAVHDTARRLGKEIDFQLAGEDVEVDRTLVEAIADPLLHMVRNAVDHGIEAAAARSAAGKPTAGHVILSAAHAGDHVLVRLEDDGKGLDPAKLTAKAKEKGLIAADAVLSDTEAWNLIFLPGFSTAEQVTGISGRGVGMDVVRRNIERVKGRVDIDSSLGEGTVFSIRLPLTTAILDAMCLRVGRERFLVPITAVIEALRPTPGQVQEVLGRGRVIQARGKLVPVLALAETFAISDAESDPTRSVLLVLEREAGDLAVQVDELLGLQQVVIKPLDGERPHHAGVAGAAIMGDGRVGLILDPARLLGAHP
jgi:two-component system chemotaxis sensor kinase CheA